MGKNKSRKNQRDSTNSSDETSGKDSQPQSQDATDTSSNAENKEGKRKGLGWLIKERRTAFWIAIFGLIGCYIGFGYGSGSSSSSGRSSPYLDAKLRITTRLMQMEIMPWNFMRSGTYATLDDDEVIARESEYDYDETDLIMEGSPYYDYERAMVTLDAAELRADPSHPTVFAVLREAIVREKGGFVHPDLGILQPAPSGAARGVGMVRNDWHHCQNICNPGTAEEKVRQQQIDQTENPHPTKNFKQEEVLIKVPLAYQMTRSVALDTLLPLIPADVQRKASIHELDDAALLVLHLAHERGVGRYSRWLPYIASLPLVPSCGYSRELRPHLLDSIRAYKEELGLDVNAWPSELLKATQYAERVANGLSRDYGSYIQHPKGVTAVENIQWALCQVASRGTAGSQTHGSLRLVPMADLVNHDASAGGFVELTGKESFDKGDFVNATEDDTGAFVVRSLRHGRRKALKVGQELLVNYNVPQYSALDWFVSLGFIPPERFKQWQKLGPGLPRVRRDSPLGASGVGERYGTASSTGSSSSSSTRANYPRSSEL